MYFALREKTPIGGIPRDLQQVHLVRPLSLKKVKELVQHCPELRMISAPQSVQKRLLPEAKKLIQKKGIQFQHAHRAGRAINMDLQTIKQIADLKKDFLSIRDIAAKTGVPKSTIHYLLKKAKRHKIKKGKVVVYVQ